MRRNSKAAGSILFSLLFATVISLIAFTAPVLAEDSGGTDGHEGPKTVYIHSLEASGTDEDMEGSGVHADPATFEKNYCLSVEQKESTIKAIEEFVSDHISSDMSDLEKYYTLARYENEHVTYDWRFWNGGYNFDYYSHQWDAYGVMVEKNAVCVGIAITYANLCHAADLPCKFVRTDPAVLDHTIAYIPNINGNAYYADVTENMFLMSKNEEAFAPIADKEFAHIKKECTDGSFEYRNKDGDVLSADLKKEGGIYRTYEEWLNEFTWHEGTDKDFLAKYEEHGSGLSPGEEGYYHASYKDFPRQFSDFGKPRTVWFLEDFYQDPEDAASKIKNKELNEQFLIISGIKKNYDCETVEELEETINNEDISIKYFPSAEGDEIIAESTQLTRGTDYQVRFKEYDDSTHEAVLIIEAADGGDYNGSCEIRVKANSSVLTKVPVRRSRLVYNGKEQKLIKEGAAENGTILYAVCKKGDPEPRYYSETIPAKVNAGKYDVWYKVKGDDNHFSMKGQKIEGTAVIKPFSIEFEQAVLSKTAFTYNAKVQKPSVKTVAGKTLKKGTDYTISWSNASSKYAGTYTLTIKGKGNYADTTDATYKINKAANTLRISGKTATVKYSAVKKKAQTLKRSKVIRFDKAGQGKKSYIKLSGNKKIYVGKKTGTVTVKKGLKKGTYKVKVKVKAAGTANYKASGWKTATFKVVVK